MTSKEALRLLETRCRFYAQDNDELQETYEAREMIEKDLEVLECFKKIDKKELNDFIENQIKYALNENSWLSTCNCDLEKEEPTQDLIKIKEWLEND